MENQRIRLSKKMLKDALIDLLSDHIIGKIKIYEICERAQINRTTFYKYYGSQYDLLDDIEADIFRELEMLLNTDYQKNADGLTGILIYFEQEHKKYQLLMNSTTDRKFGEKLFNLPIIKARMEKISLLEYTNAETEYIHTFMYLGGYAIIQKWINKEERESPEEIAQLVNKLMYKIISPIT